MSDYPTRREMSTPANFEPAEERHNELRAEILKRYPNRRENLNIGSVENFFRGQGLKIEDYLCLDDKDYLALLEELDIASRFEGYLDLNEGVRVPDISLTLIRRNAALERNNGPIYIEGLAVHELAHGTSTHGLPLTEKNPDRVPRSGFTILGKPWGWFLEEGFAEYSKGAYIKANAPAEYKERVLKSFGVQDPSSCSWDIAPMAHAEGWGFDYPVPSKYFFFREDGQLSFNVPTIAAVGVELLAKKQPALLEAMRRARTEVDGLREVAKTLNGLKPDLYTKLQEVNYAEQSFIQSLGLIINELYDGEVKRNKDKEIA